MKKNEEFYKQKLLNLKIKFSNIVDKMESNNLKKSLKDEAGTISSFSIETDAYDAEFTLNCVSSEINVLYEIDEALEKIKNNDHYGLCEKCHQQIEQKRLEAIPYAKLCLKCKEKEELEQKK